MVRRLTALVPLAALLVGCGPSRTTERMLDEVAHGEMAKAEVSAVDLYGSDSDEALVRHMEIGLIRHLGGDLEGSLKELDAAAPLVDDRRKASFTDAVTTAIVNDTVGAFQGRAYEHTQVDYYRVLDHLLMAERQESLWNPPRLFWPRGPLPPAPLNPLSAADHRQRAVIAARRMTINQLKETEDANKGRRYDDDPFARLMAGVVVASLPPQERTESDEQFAAAMLARALTAYAHQAKTLGSDQPFRYEATAEPAIARTLYLRQLLRYDPEEAQRQLEQRQLTKAQVLPPPGSGSILVLHHAGFAARPEPLQIGIGAMGFSAPAGSTCVSWGSVVFVVEGPGHEIAQRWPVLPIPGEVVQTLLAPGGAAVIGFELPAHRTDVRVPGPAKVLGAGAEPVEAEVLSDIDAYARATLKDEQPHLLVKTLLRVVAKQAAVAAGSRAIRDQNNPYANLLGFAVNLVGSAAMTATESADLRAWNTLPNRIEGSLLDLPPGSHHLTVTTTTGSCDLGEVRVVPGRLTVVALRTPDTITTP